MAITNKTLADQFYRARTEWPFIADVETRFGLPRCLLYAVGSRETNLTNERGDGGHGWGVWQLDDRSHAIPSGYLDDVRQQALDAAAHLAANYARFGEWTAACNAYNSGRPQTSSTRGGDYGPDVMSRAAFFESIASPLPTPPSPDPQPVVEDDMPLIATDPTNGDYWVFDPKSGRLDAYNADGSSGNRYFGNFRDHPQWVPPGPIVKFDYWPGAGNGPGYALYSLDGAGVVHPFHFDATTRV